MATVTQVVGKDHEEVISYVETGDATVWSPLVIEPDGKGGLFVHPHLMQAGKIYPFQVLDFPLVAYKHEDGTVDILGLPD